MSEASPFASSVLRILSAPAVITPRPATSTGRASSCIAKSEIDVRLLRLCSREPSYMQTWAKSWQPCVCGAQRKYSASLWELRFPPAIVRAMSKRWPVLAAD